MTQTPLARPFCVALICIAALLSSEPSLSCDLKRMQSIIDQVTDLKTPQGQTFKDKTEDGWNSLRALFDMTPKELHPLFDDCRHEVDEYLNKIGYPSVH